MNTLCMGQAASMASLLLCAGEQGHRRSLPHSRIMMHQPSGGFQARPPSGRLRAPDPAQLAAVQLRNSGGSWPATAALS